MSSSYSISELGHLIEEAVITTDFRLLRPFIYRYPLFILLLLLLGMRMIIRIKVCANFLIIINHSLRREERVRV